MSMGDNHIDYAVQLFLHRRFVPRPGVDRGGRPFDSNNIPDDDGRYESIRRAQSLFVNRLINKYASPCDDVYEVLADNHVRCAVRMEWLRRYWKEATA